MDGAYKRCRVCKAAFNRRYRLEKGQVPRPSSAFPCGHARTAENTELTGNKQSCRTCQATPKDTSASQGRLQRMIAQAATRKPSLYPARQFIQPSKAY